MKETQFDYLLPEELTIEILLRIPFESILECKLVSKQWKNLINDPKFYNRYGNKSVVLYLGHNGLNRLTTIAKFKDTQFPTYRIRRIPIKYFEDYNNINRFNSILLSGSSKWIACVLASAFDKFVLYNLFTGGLRIVDMAPIREVNMGSCMTSLKGFGYDRHANDHKLFIRYDNNNDNDNNNNSSNNNGLFWIYSFKKPGWKALNGFPLKYNRVTDFVACSFNGVLHWLVTTRNNRERVVVTYDLHTCRFGEILLPNIGVGSDYCGARLSELDGRLCFVHHTDRSVCCTVHVWVMKEYGVRESWTKLLDIDRRNKSYVGVKDDNAAPTLLYETKNGGNFVLFSRRNCLKLFWYNVDKNEVQMVDTGSHFKFSRNFTL